MSLSIIASRKWSLLLCLVVGLGCGTSEIPDTTQLTIGPANFQSQSPSVDETAAESDPNSDLSTEESGSESQVYTPPFPDRVDLFVPPKKRANSLALSRKEGESTVTLLGFSNVNDVRVVLSIDGFVYPVAEGESKSGIEVVSIKPPAVVLQRGREVWQASLEN